MDDEPRDRPLRTLWALRIAVPAVLLAVGYSVLVSERWSVDHELQLLGPEAVRPGDPVPLRARILGGLDDPDGGGELVEARVQIRLDGRPAGTLERSASRSSEGGLPPFSRPGTHLLRAAAIDEDGNVLATAERTIRVADDAPAAPLSGRLAGELAHFSAGPIQELGPAPTPLEIRVRGGTCVPEEPCALVIDAGQADTVRLEPSAAVTSIGGRREGPLVVLTLLARGSEAEIELSSMSRAAPASRRALRLPIALATPWLELPIATEGPHVPLEAHPPPGRTAMVADVYRGGRWTRTATIDAQARELPFELGPGLYRVQVHVDPFGAEYAAARYVLVGTALEQVPALLRAEGIEIEGMDAADPRMTLAGAEEELRGLPAPVSGLEADRAEIARRREQVHRVGGLAMLLGIVVFALSLLRRGLFAAAEARALMVEAGDASAAGRPARLRTTAVVIGLVLTTALSLAAGATILLARAALVAP